MYDERERQEILARFLRNEYEHIVCEKCMLTFLTNVYDVDEGQVLLEKRSLGLEYFCEAIQVIMLKKIPNIQRIGVLSEDGNVIAHPPSKQEIFSGNETEYRYLYVMEKLQHLNDEDTQFFDECVKEMDWKSEVQRVKILEAVEGRYGKWLAQEIKGLYTFYTQHQNVLAWDLHGDNLMQRRESSEIVVIDPYTRRA